MSTAVKLYSFQKDTNLNVYGITAETIYKCAACLDLPRWY
jgi:hypothetical protein